MEKFLEKAKTLRKANMVSAAYAQTEKMDDILDFFERYVSEWNPSKDDRGQDLVDVEAERVNRANVRHTAAATVEEMLELLGKAKSRPRPAGGTTCAWCAWSSSTTTITPIHSARQTPARRAPGSARAAATCTTAATACPGTSSWTAASR